MIKQTHTAYIKSSHPISDHLHDATTYDINLPVGVHLIVGAFLMGKQTKFTGLVSRLSKQRQP